MLLICDASVFSLLSLSGLSMLSRCLDMCSHSVLHGAVSGGALPRLLILTGETSWRNTSNHGTWRSGSVCSTISWASTPTKGTNPVLQASLRCSLFSPLSGAVNQCTSTACIHCMCIQSLHPPTAVSYKVHSSRLGRWYGKEGSGFAPVQTPRA